MSRFLNDLRNYELNESILDRGIFKAVFMAGAGGSGKSYVLSKVKSGSIEPRIVNIDRFIEYYGHDYEKEYFDRSRKQTTKQLIQYVNSLLPLAIDCTSKKHEKTIQRANILENVGYDTAMVFVNTDLDIALERSSKRKRKVPEEEIINAYNYLQKSKPYLKSKFNLFLEITNNGDIDDEVILKIFKKMNFFYDTPVRNPIGIETIEVMRKNGWKYLVPNVYTFTELEEILIPFHGRL